MATEPLSENSCLVLCPIGQDESVTRRKSDALLEQVIKPSLSSLNYSVKRGDQIRAQWITPALVEEIRVCALVVVVLTELNPNVFFEMGVAQAWCKPMVAMAVEGTKLPFDVQDLNTVFYPQPGPDHRLSDAEAVECGKKLKELASEARDKCKHSPFNHALSLIGSRFSLSAIYSGKRFILEVFEAGIQDVIGAMEKDYELVEEGKAEGLRGLAPILRERSQFFDQQSRALHKTVRVSDLSPAIGEKCFEVCDKMEALCRSAMRLADRLARKSVLETSDVELARTILSEIKREITACLDLISKYKSYFSQ